MERRIKMTDESPSGVNKAVQTRPSRAKYTCKPELQEIIDYVNLVPPDLEMKSSEELLGADRKSIPPRMATPAYREYQLRQAKTLLTYLKTFPPELLAAVFKLETFQSIYDRYQVFNEIYEQTFDPEVKADRDECENLLIRAYGITEHQYWSLRSTRKTMYRLAEIGENPEPYLGQKLEDVVLAFHLFTEYAHLDKDGRIRRSPNPFAETLEGVEVLRIRVCLVCRKLFWATRKDKRCCSEEHARIIRQRQVRANQKLNRGIYGRDTRKGKA